MVSKEEIKESKFKKFNNCPKCGQGPMQVDSSVGELFCGNCGFVIRDKLEESGPEWRAFSQEEKNIRSRTGMPSSLAVHDMGLSTIIGVKNVDATGKAVASTLKATLSRLRTWNYRSQINQPINRNLRQAFSELDRLSDKLNVSNVVIEKAAYIYRKALEKGLIRGRSMSALIVASLYAACRDAKIPRTLKDVSIISNVKKKDVARCYRLLLKEMDLKMPIVNPTKCISRIASVSKLSEKIQRKALDILDKAIQMKISAGKDPMGLAAAALYIACVLEGENKTQKDIAEAAGVTEVTIRNRYKGLKNILRI